MLKYSEASQGIPEGKTNLFDLEKGGGMGSEWEVAVFWEPSGD